jgi:hypothetical protein
MSLVTAFFGWLFVQQYFVLPDGYARDVDRDPPRYAAPCDRDNIVSIPVPGGRYLNGAELSLRYDEEDRTLGDDADTVHFRIKWKF